MQIITVCVPSAQLSPAMCEAFRHFGLNARASAQKIINGSPAERLICPIEPVDKHDLWIAIQDDTPVQAFLERTFLNTDFVLHLMASATTEDDRLALECIMTAAAARSITLAFTAKTATPSRLARTAMSQGKKPSLRALAEQVLGVPNLSDLLVEHVDLLVSRPQLAGAH